MTPLPLYRTIAVIEAITWSLLIFAMILKYTGVTEVGVSIAGSIHGFAFLVFVVTTVLVWLNNRWSLQRGVLGLASSVIPFATIPFEMAAHRDGTLDGGWRTDSPLLAIVVKRPRVTVGVLAAMVLLVFVGLLSIGGPFG